MQCILHILENEITQLKRNLQNVCHEYNKINVLYKYQHIITNQTNDKIRVLKKDITDR